MCRPQRRASTPRWPRHSTNGSPARREPSHLDTVAFGGGCFLNALLSTLLRERLEARGLTVLAPQRLSPGDGAIAVGQAWVAMQAACSPAR